jgi:hypothetical protein
VYNEDTGNPAFSVCRFLRTKGVSKETLKYKYVHKFKELIHDSISYGLPLTADESETAINWLDEFDRESINFRYMRGGAIPLLTDIHSTSLNVKRLLDVVRFACEKARNDHSS